MISVYALLALSTLLFFIGVFGFITRRNLIAMLISQWILTSQFLIVCFTQIMQKDSSLHYSRWELQLQRLLLPLL